MMRSLRWVPTNTNDVAGLPLVLTKHVPDLLRGVCTVLIAVGKLDVGRKHCDRRVVGCS